MRELYSAYTKDELWLIRDNQWFKSLQNIRETQFALGNGYIGSRGILEEIPYNCQAGTYIAGVYDRMASQVAELVNLPNPINFTLTSKGEKFDLIAMDNIEHRRVLNTKKGLLVRQTLYQDTKKRRYDYQSLRFISMHNKHIGVMQIAFTPLDAGCSLDINTGIDTSVFNARILSEGKKKHFRIKELGQANNAGFLVVETLERKCPIVYWSGFYYTLNGKKSYAKDNIFRLKVKKNQTLIFTKVFCVKHFPHSKSQTPYKKETFKIFNQAFRGDFSQLLKSHIAAWQKLWKRADIVIEGTANIQQNLRFTIYHMLICGHFDSGASSIGARTLSGEGYRGHVFWDTEIFLMPFFLLVCPHVAKNILLYRAKRLKKALELAKEAGFKGAKFPWESAYTGQEETPSWAKDLDGTLIKIHTHTFEHHITSDIAYAVYKYYLYTQDEEFMEDYGYALLCQIARFWASRLEPNRKRRYEIRNVIGPDEFHINVNNNAFTNMMAKWNLITASKVLSSFKKKRYLYNSFARKLGLGDREIRSWRRMAAKIVFKVDRNKVIEQFDGYFRLKKVIPTQTDENGMPLFPKGVKLKSIGHTQLIKQADVLMLLWLLDDTFSAKTKKANYSFYLPRTMHKSSLSPSVHALLACQASDLHKAYSLFNVALRTDISNLYSNTREGVHAANLGGTWQVVVFGFAGVSVRKEKLCIDPRLPRTWKRMVFTFSWQKNLVRLELTSEAVKIKVSSSRTKHLTIKIFDRPCAIRTNKSYVFRRKGPRYRREDYY